jgi:hypothetical protein
MCFSAGASFTASAFLAACGVGALLLAKGPAQRPIAAVPLLFALQQGIEGLVWLSFEWGSPAATSALGQAYTFFSHVFWPAYIPFATWRAEPAGPRRTLLGGATVAGLMVGTLLAWSIAVDPITPVAVGGHIAYESRQLVGPAVMLLYLGVTTGALATSSRGFIRAFGVTSLFAFGAAYLAYARWFVSVWCFLAAWLSFVLVLHFAGLRAAAVVARAAGGARGAATREAPLRDHGA